MESTTPLKMKASTPSILSPLSRSKKNNGATPMLAVVLVSMSAFIFVVFYMTVYHAMKESSDSHAQVRAQRTGAVADFPMNELQSIHRLSIEPKDESVDSIESYSNTVILKTSLGDIVIELLPHLSPESVVYIHQIVKTGCDRCTFYRAEKPGIFQGMIKSESVPPTTVKGQCPPEDLDNKQDCPKHDVNCGCHGPIMTKGMVGWAGGGTGPDFFINTYKLPATHWGNQHTVWGRITDEQSLALIMRIYDFPVTNRNGMNFLNENIKFTMALKAN